MCYDIEKQEANVLQIPRDTYVTVANKLYLDENNRLTADNYTGGYGCKRCGCSGRAACRACGRRGTAACGYRRNRLLLRRQA